MKGGLGNLWQEFYMQFFGTNIRMGRSETWQSTSDLCENRRLTHAKADDWIVNKSASDYYAQKNNGWKNDSQWKTVNGFLTGKIINEIIWNRIHYFEWKNSWNRKIHEIDKFIESKLKWKLEISDKKKNNKIISISI